MRALVFTAAGQVELRDEPAPEPADDEVLVTVEASGICGSELHGFRSVGFRRPPMIMGHEFAGRTDDGTAVVVNPLVTCGACTACQAGRPQLCPARELLGVHRAGGFAEQVAVPAGNVHALPAGTDWSCAALIEPLANAVHAVRLAGDHPGRVAVIGAGAIGLVCLLVAQIDSAETVVVADPSPQRRRLAERLGAETVESLDTRDSAPFDLTVEAVGLPLTRASALGALRPGGTSVWLGLATAEAGGDAADLVRQEKRVLGSFAYTPQDFATAVQLAGSLDLGWGTDVPMREAEAVFMELAGGRTDITKAVLRMEAV
jgi:threonine dehydrogenase-like Zn-dependent dehydrogenase